MNAHIHLTVRILIWNFKCLHNFIFFMAYIFYIHFCSRPESGLNQASQVVQWLKNKIKSVFQCRLGPWFKKTPCRRKWQPTPVFLPGKYREQCNLAGYSPWGCKESVRTEWLSVQEHIHYVLLCSQSVQSLEALQWLFDDSPQFLCTVWAA